MTMIERERVDAVAKAIARMIPIEGSRWNPGYGHNFPHEYSEKEIRLIRGIAKVALETDAALKEG